MRKTIAILLTLMTLLAAGCGSKPSETPDESQAPAFASAVDLYTQIWDTLGEDRQFPAAGGDAEHETEAPAKFALTKENKETFEYLLHVTDELYDMLDDDAATLQHMMNTNTFSSAAAKLKDPSEAEEFAEAYKTAVQGQQWMCGFPDKMVIAKVSGCIVSVYGAEDLVNTFRDKLTAAYENAEIVYDEAIAF